MSTGKLLNIRAGTLLANEIQHRAAKRGNDWASKGWVQRQECQLHSDVKSVFVMTSASTI